MILHYGREIDQQKEELAHLKHAASAKYVKSNSEVEAKYAKMIKETHDALIKNQEQQKKVEEEYHLAKKEYKKFA